MAKARRTALTVQSFVWRGRRRRVTPSPKGTLRLQLLAPAGAGGAVRKTCICCSARHCLQTWGPHGRLARPTSAPRECSHSHLRFVPNRSVWTAYRWLILSPSTGVRLNNRRSQKTVDDCRLGASRGVDCHLTRSPLPTRTQQSTTRPDGGLRRAIQRSAAVPHELLFPCGAL